jgi:hypothetical protein
MMTNYIKYEVRVYAGGHKCWFLNDKRHREDGPAIERSNGDKSWFLHGELHREDGPAVEYSNGGKYWYINDELHREDGPAIEWAGDYEAWYLNDERLTEEEFNERMTPTIEMTMAEINEALGKNVKVVK